MADKQHVDIQGRTLALVAMNARDVTERCVFLVKL